MRYRDRIKAARKHAQLTQTQLAAAVGVDQTAISALERGNTASSKHNIEIARACGVNVQWLEREEGEMLALQARSRPRDIAT